MSESTDKRKTASADEQKDRLELAINLMKRGAYLYGVLTTAIDGGEEPPDLSVEDRETFKTYMAVVRQGMVFRAERSTREAQEAQELYEMVEPYMKKGMNFREAYDAALKDGARAVQELKGTE